MNEAKLIKDIENRLTLILKDDILVKTCVDFIEPLLTDFANSEQPDLSELDSECPKCQSSNIHLNIENDYYWCNSCDEEWTFEPYLKKSEVVDWKPLRNTLSMFSKEIEYMQKHSQPTSTLKHFWKEISDFITANTHLHPKQEKQEGEGLTCSRCGGNGIINPY